MIGKVLWGLGAVGWFVLFTLVGLYVTFPSDVAKERVIHEFDKANEGEFALQMGDLSLWRLTGVQMDQVEVMALKRGKRSKDNPKPGMEATSFLKLDELALRAQLLPLALGQRAVAFSAELWGGTIDGTFSTSTALTEVEGEAHDLDLSRFPIQNGETVLNLVGTLDAEASLSLNTEELKESKGKLRVGFSSLGLGDGSKAGGFGLPVVSFTKAEVIFEVKDGKMEVTSGDFESSELTATLSGDITLNKKLSRSRNRLELAFSLPPNLDELARIAPEMKRARDEDGKYHAMISGTLASPSFRLSRTRVGERAGPITGSGPVALGGGLGEGGSPLPSDMSEEERRVAREKRIQDRRERLRKRREELEESRKANGASALEQGPDGEPFVPGRGEPYIPPGEYPTPDELERMKAEAPTDPRYEGPGEEPPPADFGEDEP